MHGHHNHHIRIAIVAVNVADQRHFLQISCQRSFLAALLLIGFHGAHQLAKVFQAGLAFFAFLFQHGLVAGILDHILHKFIQRQGGAFFFQLAIQGIKRIQRPGGTANAGILHGLPAHLQHTAAQPGGDFGHTVHRGGADLAGGLVNDTAQAQIILRVGDHRQIRKDILDFLTIIKALAAHDLIRNACPGKIGFHRAGLRIHAIQHRMVLQLCALF